MIDLIFPQSFVTIAWQPGSPAQPVKKWHEVAVFV
jgi:hypothetical protein